MAARKKAPARPDGRRQRSEASRERIVMAMLKLIEEGSYSPGAEEVAARAGVGLRTVFRHFDNMETLYQQIGAHMGAEIIPIATRPFAHMPWPKNLREVMERRIRIYERIMPFRIAADIRRYESPFIEKQSARLAEYQRELLLTHLPKDVIKDATRLESLDLVLSFDTWRRLRKEQHLSVPKARRTLEHLVAALVGPF